MPSFDIVSEVDSHEASNAVDQANRELDNRFDFRGTGAKFELDKSVITMRAENGFQLQQMLAILQSKVAKRGIDVRSLDSADPQESLHEARQLITIKQGIEQDLAKKIIKKIKDTKIKVQASIQGEKIRVTGKKRDDLQEIISFLKEQDLTIPLQYDNFRD